MSLSTVDTKKVCFIDGILFAQYIFEAKK